MSPSLARKSIYKEPGTSLSPGRLKWALFMRGQVMLQKRQGLVEIKVAGFIG